MWASVEHEKKNIYIYVCIDICVCICVYICMYMCIYIHMFNLCLHMFSTFSPHFPNCYSLVWDHDASYQLIRWQRCRSRQEERRSHRCRNPWGHQHTQHISRFFFKQSSTQCVDNVRTNSMSLFPRIFIQVAHRCWIMNDYDINNAFVKCKTHSVSWLLQLFVKNV